MSNLRIRLEDPSKRTIPFIPVARRRVCVDFETRSQLSIFDVGGWIYSKHPSTSILCLCWSYDGDDRVYRWNPAFPDADINASGDKDLKVLFDRIAEGYEVEAHNAFFELSVWTNIGHGQLNWPMVPMNQWRCSASKACAFNLPRALEDVCGILDLPQQKDMLGHASMQKCARYRKATKKLPGRWHEDKDDLEQTFLYCAQDVRAEKCLSDYLRELRPHELEIWQMDQRMNLRGVYCDIDGAKAAIGVAQTLVDNYIAELQEITGDRGDGTKKDTGITPTKRDRVKNWCKAQGYNLANTQGDYIDSLLEDPSEEMSDDVRRVLEIMRACGRSSISKYIKMVETADTDGRMRDLMMYHGASTGRWTGRYVQPHNFVRGNIKQMEALWIDIIRVYEGKLSPLWLTYAWNDAMEALSFATRGAITATPGKKLWVADYSAIEARVLFWLFDETEALEVFRGGQDIYSDLATLIFGRLITKADAFERQLGKKAILGLGYQMGATRFQEECAAEGITISLEFAKKVVDTYRAKYKKVSRGWSAINEAAIVATRLAGKGPGGQIIVQRDGKPKFIPNKTGTEGVVRYGKISYAVVGRFLHCKLPSGRLLSYLDPEIIDKMTPWGVIQPALAYTGQDDKIKVWVPKDVYGGLLVENIVQAIARDIMADAMLEVDRHPIYDLLLSVHDEVIAEADEDKGSQEEFDELMCRMLPWAITIPITVESWTGTRYRK